MLEAFSAVPSGLSVESRGGQLDVVDRQIDHCDLHLVCKDVGSLEVLLLWLVGGAEGGSTFSQAELALRLANTPR